MAFTSQNTHPITLFTKTSQLEKQLYFIFLKDNDFLLIN